MFALKKLCFNLLFYFWKFILLLKERISSWTLSKTKLDSKEYFNIQLDFRIGADNCSLRFPSVARNVFVLCKKCCWLGKGFRCIEQVWTPSLIFKSTNSSHRPFFTLDYNNDAEYEYPMLEQTREIYIYNLLAQLNHRSFFKFIILTITLGFQKSANFYQEMSHFFPFLHRVPVYVPFSMSGAVTTLLTEIKWFQPCLPRFLFAYSSKPFLIHQKALLP